MSDFLPITLSSRCLTYKDKSGNPVSPTNITARSYQGGDQIYLSQINPLNLERNYFEVLKSVIKGVDPSQLTLGDRMYLILWEYVNSYSRTMKIETICSNCLANITIDVDLANLENIELPEDFKQPCPITLPVSKEKVNLRLLTVGDEIETERFTRKHPDDAILYRYARTIVTDMDIIATVEKLRNMDAKDLMTIISFQDTYFHGPVMKTKFTCPKERCGEEDEVDIPFHLEFFFPDVSQFAISTGEGV